MQKLILFVSLLCMSSIFAQKTNNALHFQNNDYVNISSVAPKLNNLKNFSIEFWVKYDGKDNTDYNAFYGVNTSYYSNRMIIRCSNPSDGIDGSVVVYLKNNSDYYMKGKIRTDDGKCHHIAFTYDNQVCKLYIDGVIQDTLLFPFSFAKTDIHSLGQEYDDSPIVTSQFYTGLLDDFRIWNITKTQNEIFKNKNTELSGSEAGLIAYYDFNQGIANGDNSGITSLVNKALTNNPLQIKESKENKIEENTTTQPLEGIEESFFEPLIENREIISKNQKPYYSQSPLLKIQELVEFNMNGNTSNFVISKCVKSFPKK